MSGPGFIQGVPDFDKLEIIKVGYANLSTSATSNYTTIAHNFGFRPLVLAYLNDVGLSIGGTPVFTDGDVPLPTYLGESHSVVDGFVKFNTWVTANVDITNLYLLCFNASGSNFGTFTIKYYLLRERTK